MGTEPSLLTGLGVDQAAEPRMSTSSGPCSRPTQTPLADCTNSQSRPPARAPNSIPTLSDVFGRAKTSLSHFLDTGKHTSESDEEPMTPACDAPRSSKSKAALICDSLKRRSRPSRGSDTDEELPDLRPPRRKRSHLKTGSAGKGRLLDIPKYEAVTAAPCETYADVQARNIQTMALIGTREVSRTSDAMPNVGNLEAVPTAKIEAVETVSTTDTIPCEDGRSEARKAEMPEMEGPVTGVEDVLRSGYATPCGCPSIGAQEASSTTKAMTWSPFMGVEEVVNTSDTTATPPKTSTSISCGVSVCSFELKLEPHSASLGSPDWHHQTEAGATTADQKAPHVRRNLFGSPKSEVGISLQSVKREVSPCKRRKRKQWMSEDEEPAFAHCTAHVAQEAGFGAWYHEFVRCRRQAAKTWKECMQCQELHATYMLSKVIDSTQSATISGHHHTTTSSTAPKTFSGPEYSSISSHHHLESSNATPKAISGPEQDVTLSPADFITVSDSDGETVVIELSTTDEDSHHSAQKQTPEVIVISDDDTVDLCMSSDDDETMECGKTETPCFTGALKGGEADVKPDPLGDVQLLKREPGNADKSEDSAGEFEASQVDNVQRPQEGSMTDSNGDDSEDGVGLPESEPHSPDGAVSQLEAPLERIVFDLLEERGAHLPLGLQIFYDCCTDAVKPSRQLVGRVLSVWRGAESPDEALQCHSALAKLQLQHRVLREQDVWRCLYKVVTVLETSDCVVRLDANCRLVEFLARVLEEDLSDVMAGPGAAAKKSLVYKWLDPVMDSSRIRQVQQWIGTAVVRNHSGPAAGHLTLLLDSLSRILGLALEICAYRKKCSKDMARIFCSIYVQLPLWAHRRALADLVQPALLQSIFVATLLENRATSSHIPEDLARAYRAQKLSMEKITRYFFRMGPLSLGEAQPNAPTPVTKEHYEELLVLQLHLLRSHLEATEDSDCTRERCGPLEAETVVREFETRCYRDCPVLKGNYSFQRTLICLKLLFV